MCIEGTCSPSAVRTMLAPPIATIPYRIFSSMVMTKRQWGLDLSICLEYLSLVYVSS